MSKCVWEMIEECQRRGVVMTVQLVDYLSGKTIASLDRFDAVDNFGERIVMKHKRNKTALKLWILS